ncbi:AAA family ATPase [Microbacterium sp. 179-I 3D2 NHS]|uniref:MinD/ParA family ATP-binding protein n=1 Tax=Microbacterium sp. 179-I 3D2 NHS TaxID=3235178 RepID=UPI0039A3D5EF
MTPKNTADPEDEPTGVLDEAASVDTAGIGILGGTAQVSVTLPKDDDDDLADDGVVEGEVVGDLLIDDPVTVVPAPSEPPLFTDRIVIEAPVAATASTDEVVDAELIDADAAPRSAEHDAADTPSDAAEDAHVIDEPEGGAGPDVATVPQAATEPQVDAASVAEAVSDAGSGADAAGAPEVTAVSSATAGRLLARADADARAARAAVAAAAARASVEKETEPVTRREQKSVVPQPAPAASRADVTLASKRLDDLGESSRESADLLTADRLLDPHRVAKPEPEGAWSHLLYTVSGRRINIGDGRRARERKALSARIAAPLPGGARFVPVLSRKGGVGKTTITALLGMALADARDDRVIAVDANPDRGTLAERIVRPHHSRSVRDLVRIHDDVRGYHDISAIVARDATRLDVLASDADPRIAEAFSDSDYRDVADVAAHYYSLVLTDTGTGIVHSVMSATLDLADQIVIVSGLSVDEARLASETLTWLETNGYAEQAREAIVVLNQSTPGAPLVRLNELQSHFATRARSVVRMPYDPQIAGGGTIVFANLQPETRVAARELAALLVEGLRTRGA